MTGVHGDELCPLPFSRSCRLAVRHGTVAAGDESNSLLLDRRLPGNRIPSQRCNSSIVRKRIWCARSPASHWGGATTVSPCRFSRNWRLDSRRSLLINALAIEWQHSMNASNYLTSAPVTATASTAMQSCRAPRERPHAFLEHIIRGESRVIGRLYAGDEDVKERNNGNADVVITVAG